MKKIKIAEIFHSLQGEGLYVGQPSVFVRTFGCNFSCSGFGMEMGQKSVEADNVGIQRKFHPEWSYDTLPLVSTGCDSYASWHPKFKDLSKMMTTEEIVIEMEKVRQFNEPFPIIHGGVTHLVITGGEPLLGWQRAYPELLTKAAEIGYKHVTFETNGTQKITPEFEDFLKLNHIKGPNLNITFSVSPKLPCSGEKMEDALQPDVLASYQRYGITYLKFVISDSSDVQHVNGFVDAYKEAGWVGETFVMPCGGNSEMYNMNAPEVARVAMYGGYRYSPRLQVDLWKNAWGT